MCRESSTHDVPNDAWVCTTRYEWTSSKEAKDTRRLSAVGKILYVKAELMFFTFSIIDVGDMWINGSKDNEKMTND